MIFEMGKSKLDGFLSKLQIWLLSAICGVVTLCFTIRFWRSTSDLARINFWRGYPDGLADVKIVRHYFLKVFLLLLQIFPIFLKILTKFILHRVYTIHAFLEILLKYPKFLKSYEDWMTSKIVKL